MSAGGPGSFLGTFDTDRSREHHTLKEAVMIISPENRDSTCGDDYPPCPSLSWGLRLHRDEEGLKKALRIVERQGGCGG